MQSTKESRSQNEARALGFPTAKMQAISLAAPQNRICRGSTLSDVPGRTLGTRQLHPETLRRSRPKTIQQCRSMFRCSLFPKPSTSRCSKHWAQVSCLPHVFMRAAVAVQVEMVWRSHSLQEAELAGNTSGEAEFVPTLEHRGRIGTMPQRNTLRLRHTSFRQIKGLKAAVFLAPPCAGCSNQTNAARYI